MNDSNQLLVSPLVFFLPVHKFVELWSGLKGTAIINLVAEQSAVPLRISEKTLRKHLFKQPDQPKPKNFQNKMLAWIENPQQDPSVKQKFDDLMTAKCARTGEMQWKAIISGVSSVPDHGLTNTMVYLEQVLDDESIYFQQAFGHRQQPEALLKSLYQAPYFKRFGLPIPESLLQESLQHSAHNEWLLQQPPVLRSLLHGCISLQLDIAACAEVDFLSQNFANDPQETRYRSLIRQILPQVSEDGENVTRPVNNYFKQVRKDFSYRSWHEMAEHVPMDASTEADFESKRRKLMGWINAEHLPKADDVDKFLEALIHKHGNKDLIYYRLLYCVATFLERLLRASWPVFEKLGFSVDDVVFIFNTFDTHFKRHKEAAIQNARGCQHQAT